MTNVDIYNEFKDLKGFTIGIHGVDASRKRKRIKY